MLLQKLVLCLFSIVGNYRSKATTDRIVFVAPIIQSEATSASLPPVLLGALIYRESAFDPRARGKRGEVGLMQLHPRGWASRLCRDIRDRWDPWSNVRCGARILAWARTRCGSLAKGLTLYNGGACRESSYSRRVIAAAVRAGGAL